jgi:hypothetical protein
MVSCLDGKTGKFSSKELLLASMAIYAYNPSYSTAADRKITSSRSAQTKVNETLFYKQNAKRTGWWHGSRGRMLLCHV